MFVNIQFMGDFIWRIMKNNLTEHIFGLKNAQNEP